MDVGRLVPGDRQVLGHRHASAEAQLHADLPVAEIGEGDDGVPADAQHLLQHQPWAARRLQRLRQDHVVEASRPGSRADRCRHRPGSPRGRAPRTRSRPAARSRCRARRRCGRPAACAAACRRRSRRRARANRAPPCRRRARGRCASRSRLSGSIIGIGHHGARRTVEPARPRGRVDEAARRREQLGDVEQEGVVALVGLDLDEGHRRARRVQRMHDGPAVRGREQPVGGEGHDAEARLRAREGARPARRHSRRRGRNNPWRG